MGIPFEKYVMMHFDAKRLFAKKYFQARTDNPQHTKKPRSSQI